MEAKPLGVPPRVKRIARWMKRQGVPYLRLHDDQGELELDLRGGRPPAPAPRDPPAPKTPEQLAKDALDARRRSYAIELGCRPEDITNEMLERLP